MASGVLAEKRIVLKYSNGTYSFKNVLLSATNAQLYALASLLNTFQDEQPEKIFIVELSRIV